MHPDEYHKLAQVEDRMWYFHALHERIEAALRDTLGEARGQVLDAGCGTGGLIRRLSARHPAWEWTGVDADPTALRLARDRTAAPLVEASVTALPFAEGAFDAVVSADVLCNLDDDVAALREMRRVLRPGGLLVINVPACRWLWSYHDEAVHSRRRYERAQLRDALRAGGFEQLRVTYRQTLLLPLIAARRKLLPPPASGSDVAVSAPVVDAVLRAVTRVEAGLLATCGSLPCGASLFATALR